MRRGVGIGKRKSGLSKATRTALHHALCGVWDRVVGRVALRLRVEPIKFLDFCVSCFFEKGFDYVAPCLALFRRCIFVWLGVMFVGRRMIILLAAAVVVTGVDKRLRSVFFIHDPHLHFRAW